MIYFNDDFALNVQINWNFHKKSLTDSHSPRLSENAAKWKMFQCDFNQMNRLRMTHVRWWQNTIRDSMVFFLLCILLILLILPAHSSLSPTAEKWQQKSRRKFKNFFLRFSCEWVCLLFPTCFVLLRAMHECKTRAARVCWLAKIEWSQNVMVQRKNENPIAQQQIIYSVLNESTRSNCLVFAFQWKLNS